MYNNYASFIKRAEIRIYDQQQSLQAVPLKTIAVDDAGLAEWQPTPEILAGPGARTKYVLRAYDPKGNFDETDARPLRLYREPSPGKTSPLPNGPPARELLAAYGENDLARQQIPLGSGTVKVQGSGIPAGHTVWIAGRQFRLIRRATLPQKRSFRRARIRSKSQCSMMGATARYIFAI